MNKQCFKCKENKPISEFYKHSKMADGHLNKCKTCAKRDVHENTSLLKNDPNWVSKERERCRAKQAKRRSLGLTKSNLDAKRRWAIKHIHKRRAQWIAAIALKRGEIKIKTNCEKCGISGRLHKHHPDYSFPKMIVWLCPSCHGIEHRKKFGVPVRVVN